MSNRGVDVDDGAIPRNDIHHELLHAGGKKLLLHASDEVHAEQVRHGAASVGGKENGAIAVEQNRRHLAPAIRRQPLFGLADKIEPPEVERAKPGCLRGPAAWCRPARAASDCDS